MKMIKLMLAAIVACWMHSVAQATPGFVLTNDCSAEVTVTVTNAVKLGDKIEVGYELRATTNMPQMFMEHSRLDDIGVFVFDHAWRILPSKVEYPMNPPARTAIGGSMRFCDISKQPWRGSFDLSQYCDITEPGIYRVMVVCPVSKWKGRFESEIASKPAEFMVLPKSAP